MSPGCPGLWPPGALPMLFRGIGPQRDLAGELLGLPLLSEGVGQVEAWGLEYARMTDGQTPGGLQGAPEAWASRESCTKADPRGPGEGVPRGVWACPPSVILPTWAEHGSGCLEGPGLPMSTQG